MGLHDDVTTAHGLILLEIVDTLETFEKIDEVEGIDEVDIAQISFAY